MNSTLTVGHTIGDVQQLESRLGCCTPPLGILRVITNMESACARRLARELTRCRTAMAKYAGYRHSLVA
jgi:hypothetical protein